MSAQSILLSGPTVGSDLQLASELGELCAVRTNRDNTRIPDLLADGEIGLVIIEIPAGGEEQLQIIRDIHRRHASLPIILIDGEDRGETIIKAFSCGVLDAFKKPYKRYLVVERASAVLR